MTRASTVTIRAALLLGIIGTGTIPTVTPKQVEAAGANLDVTATVIDDCTLSTSAVAFGNYGSNRATPLSGTGEITYSCSSGLEIMIEVDEGANAEAGQRQMASENLSTTEFLTYNLYQSDGGAVWGEGAQAMTINPTPGGSVPLTVYGVVDELQAVAADEYSDTVGVVLTIL